MSDGSSDNKILIKFEIHVPVGAGQTPVVIQPAPAVPTAALPPPSAPQPPVGGKLNAFTIQQPAISASTSVKATSGNTTGQICVVGSNDFDALNRVPVEVRCKMIDCTANINSTPDGDAVRPIQNDGSTFLNWHIDFLPGAKCSWSGTGTNLPYNELVVWRQYSGETFWTIEVRSFRGACSDQTECEKQSGFASPPAARVLDTVPQAMHVLTAGFSGALAALNGTWLLPHFPRVAAGILSWMCGGDGTVAPRVELSGKACGCEPMELQLACGGQNVVYVIPRDAFNPLGANRFVLRNDQRPPYDSQLPTELVVKPACSRA